MYKRELPNSLSTGRRLATRFRPTKNPRNSRQIFFGVIAAGILSVGPTLGLLTDGLGLIPPRAAVADETLPVDAEHK